MADAYDIWLNQVREALRSINMRMEDWQNIWPYDFPGQYETGAKADHVAMKANRYWWREQNKSLNQNCQKMPGCWLVQGHQGDCQPIYEPGDYVKVEFSDETTGIGEWMWLRVDHRDDDKRVLYGRLDNEPINDYGRKVMIGCELAVSYDRVRDHKKVSDFGS